MGGGGGVGTGVVEVADVDETENEVRWGDGRAASSIPGGEGDRCRQRRNRRLSWKLLTNKKYIKFNTVNKLIFL